MARLPSPLTRPGIAAIQRHVILAWRRFAGQAAGDDSGRFPPAEGRPCRLGKEDGDRIGRNEVERCAEAPCSPPTARHFFPQRPSSSSTSSGVSRPQPVKSPRTTPLPSSSISFGVPFDVVAGPQAAAVQQRHGQLEVGVLFPRRVHVAGHRQRQHGQLLVGIAHLLGVGEDGGGGRRGRVVEDEQRRVCRGPGGGGTCCWRRGRGRGSRAPRRRRRRRRAARPADRRSRGPAASRRAAPPRRGA